MLVSFFFQAEDGIRDIGVTGVQTCALPISTVASSPYSATYSWSAGASASGPQTVTAEKGAGLQSSSAFTVTPDTSAPRSEERRVGEECRSRGSRRQSKKKGQNSRDKCRGRS